ncbi:hypothetical protein PG997_005652 [Apiospora hydei]|uniref:Uncharacterized protein n=1 Tax=Apiospora hydei TaxID=1337664 RepID=A0ABR1WPK3_9PEZI
MSNNTTQYNYTASAAELQAITIEEAACYALPFGGIGFASHMLTYYTAVMLVLGPPAPEAVEALVITIVLTSISISRCWKSWPFATLGVWMLTTSVCVSVLPMIMSSIHNQVVDVERIISMYEDKAEVTTRVFLPGTKRILIWLALLWILGSFAGVAGTTMISLPHYVAAAVDHRYGPLFILTSVFAGMLILPLVLMLWSCCVLAANTKFIFRVLVYVVLAVMVIALPWMDWSLGLITGNMAGMPSGDAKVLYFGYVVAKRLGLFSLRNIRGRPSATCIMVAWVYV